MTTDHPEERETEGRGTLTIVEGGAYSPRELSVARLLAQRGYHVVLRPPIGTRIGGETSDLLLDGRGYDIYTPTTANPNRIISAIAKKNAQAEGVVLDLSTTSVTRLQLGNILERVQGAGATNIRDVIVLEEKYTCQT
jgi:filamentous hemagglutinin